MEYDFQYNVTCFKFQGAAIMEKQKRKKPLLIEDCLEIIFMLGSYMGHHALLLSNPVFHKRTSSDNLFFGDNSWCFTAV